MPVLLPLIPFYRMVRQLIVRGGALERCESGTGKPWTLLVVMNCAYENTFNILDFDSWGGQLKACSGITKRNILLAVFL